MNRLGVLPAAHLKTKVDGIYISVAGLVIARQRPGSAQGFIFLSMEDEPASPTQSSIPSYMNGTGSQ
jgi:error-prone DNA polymerase